MKGYRQTSQLYHEGIRADLILRHEEIFMQPEGA